MPSATLSCDGIRLQTVTHPSALSPHPSQGDPISSHPADPAASTKNVQKSHSHAGYAVMLIESDVSVLPGAELAG